MKNCIYRELLILVCTGILSLSATNSCARELTLAVANSTCATIQQVGMRFAEQHGVTINYLCKSSGLLAKGLRGGAINADIYLSANRHWMDYMIDGGMIDPARVTNPWGNTLVVATRADSKLFLDNWDDLASDKVKGILIGDPGTAPFGRYAKEAMESTGVWESVRGKITTEKHISLLAETLRQADANTVGILFKTNVIDGLKTLYTVDESWHTPIRYYIAPLGTAAEDTLVRDLLTFIHGTTAQGIFRDAGFRLMTP